MPYNSKYCCLYHDFKSWAIKHGWFCTYENDEKGYCDWLTPTGEKLMLHIVEGRVVKTYTSSIY